MVVTIDGQGPRPAMGRTGPASRFLPALVVALTVSSLVLFGTVGEKDGFTTTVSPPSTAGSPAPVSSSTSAPSFVAPRRISHRVVAAVRLVGGPFFERATTGPNQQRGRGEVVAPETLIDGEVFGWDHQWDEGPVWWETETVGSAEGDQEPGRIELDLVEPIWIVSVTIQADSNDEYLLSHHDPETGQWMPLWCLLPAGEGEMRIRRHEFPEPVNSQFFRFEAISGDGRYSVSEISFGQRPEPVWGRWVEDA